MSRKLIWLILLIALLIRLPSLFKPHIENDEIIFQTLTVKVAKTRSLRDYTLKGEEILEKLPASLYDTVLFQHPPGFVVASSLVYILSGDNVRAMLLVPVLGALVSVFCVYWIGKILNSEQVGLMSAMILAVEPVLLFSSTRFLIDGLLTGLVSLAMLFFVRAIKFSKWRDWLWCGFFTAIAILTKYPAILLLPIMLGSWLVSSKKKLRAKNLLSFIFPLILLVGGWWSYYYHVTGLIFPLVGKPTQELIDNFPFMKMVVNRPMYYYFKQLLITSPLVSLGLVLAVYSWIKNRQATIELLWAGMFIVGLTGFGILKGGYQMRYIAMAMPGLALLAGQQQWLKTYLSQTVLLFGIVIGFVTGLLNAYAYLVADVFSIFELF